MAGKYIVLDRDGVINEASDSYVKSTAELKIIKSSLQAISALTKEGYLVFVVTNQSAIGRGLTTAEAVKKINMEISSLVARSSGSIERFYCCPHLPSADCQCRKPKTGLLKQIEADFSISLAGSFFVGDSISDVRAAQAHSMVPLIVRTGYGTKTEASIADVSKKYFFNNLFDAVKEGVLRKASDE